MMSVIASEAKQSLHYKVEIATARQTTPGLAMTVPQSQVTEQRFTRLLGGREKESLSDGAIRIYANPA
jgi:hypothetical protein